MSSVGFRLGLLCFPPHVFQGGNRKLEIHQHPSEDGTTATKPDIWGLRGENGKPSRTATSHTTAAFILGKHMPAPHPWQQI